MCSGCYNENLRHRRVQQMEQTILMNFASNLTLAHIKTAILKPINLQDFRKLFHCIPIFHNVKRDDHIYGAARYLANTLGFMIQDDRLLDRVDQVAERQQKQLWRKATFKCRCKRSIEHQTQQYDQRTFCKTCSFLIYKEHTSHITRCPACNRNDSWQTLGHTCLNCQLAAVTYINPFHKRFQYQLELWLSHDSDNTDTDDCSATMAGDVSKNDKTQRTNSLTTYNDKELLIKRNRAIEASFREIKSKSKPEHTRKLFSELAALQRSIQQHHRSTGSIEQDGYSTAPPLDSISTKNNILDVRGNNIPTACSENYPHDLWRESVFRTRNIPANWKRSSEGSVLNITRPPFMPIDLNRKKTQEHASQKARQQCCKGYTQQNIPENMPYMSTEPVNADLSNKKKVGSRKDVKRNRTLLAKQAKKKLKS